MGIQAEKELSTKGRVSAFKTIESSRATEDHMPGPQPAKAGPPLSENHLHHPPASLPKADTRACSVGEDGMRSTDFEKVTAHFSPEFASKIPKHDYFLSPHMNLYYEESLSAPRIPLAPIPILPSNIPQARDLSTPSKSSAFKRFLPSKNKLGTRESTSSVQAVALPVAASKNIVVAHAVERCPNAGASNSALDSPMDYHRVKCEESMAPLESSRMGSTSAEIAFSVRESPSSSHGGSNESSITKQASLSLFSANYGMASPWKGKSHNNEKVSPLSHHLSNSHNPFMVPFPPEPGVSEGEESSFSQGTDRTSESGLGDGCKKCSCKKSQCLKLYCECFRSSVYCSGSCKCVDCLNNAQNEHAVQEARRNVWARNALAFTPRIVFSSLSPSPSSNPMASIPPQPHHRNGCNCRKSMCTKKYCECFQAGTACTKSCRCHESCKNPYGSCMGNTTNASSKLNTIEMSSNHNNPQNTDYKDSPSFHTSPVTPKLQEKYDLFTRANNSPDFYSPKQSLATPEPCLTSTIHQDNPLVFHRTPSNPYIHVLCEASGEVTSPIRLNGKSDSNVSQIHGRLMKNDKDGPCKENECLSHSNPAMDSNVDKEKNRNVDKGKSSSHQKGNAPDFCVDSCEMLRILLRDTNSWRYFDHLGEQKSYLFDFVSHMHVSNPEEVKICQKIIFGHNLSRQDLFNLPPSVLCLINLIFGAKQFLLTTRLETMVEEILTSRSWKILSHENETLPVLKSNAEPKSHFEKQILHRENLRQDVPPSIGEEKVYGTNRLASNRCSSMDKELQMSFESREDPCSEDETEDRLGQTKGKSLSGCELESSLRSKSSGDTQHNVHRHEHLLARQKPVAFNPLPQGDKNAKEIREENKDSSNAQNQSIMNRDEDLDESRKTSSKNGFCSNSAKVMADVYNDMLKHKVLSLRDVKNEDDVLHQKKILHELLTNLMAIESCISFESK